MTRPAGRGVTRATVTAVSSKAIHGPDKPNRDRLVLIAGQGVEGDAHCGSRVRHRSRVARDPSQPNLRQVHLIHGELFEELARLGFAVTPGLMGENITTRGIDLLGLSTGARLRIGQAVLVEVTGLRNPCTQLDELQPGLMGACLGRDAEGQPVRKAGVMGVVLAGGQVAPGDPIVTVDQPGPHRALKPV